MPAVESVPPARSAAPAPAAPAARGEPDLQTSIDARGEPTRGGRHSDPVPRLTSLAPGDLLAGRYRVVSSIGEGGCSEVYEVRDERAGRDLALKLHRIASRAPWAIEALRGEFALLASLDHPNLARVHDFGYLGDAAFFTQALVRGAPLDAAGLDLVSPEAIELLAQLCRALDYLHARGLLHRDVKPSNVLVERGTGRVVLLDFGIARAFGEARRAIHGGGPGAGGAGAGGGLMGTFAFMAPEAIRGQPLDGRSDLYALGVTLYKLASGQLPFATRGRDATEVLWDHLMREPPPLPGSVPPAVAAVITRLLAKEPADRFATAGEALSALSAAAGHPVAQETPEMLASYVLSARYVEPELLDELWRAIEPARPWPPALLLGDGGSGKSRVMHELRCRAQIRGVPWVAVDARGGDPAAGLLRDLAEAVISPELAAALPEEDRKELARAVPALRRPRERLALPVDPERAEALRLEALGRALALRFAGRRGVLAIEDLHHRDEQAAAQLGAVVEAAAAAGARCAVVVSARPGRAAEALADRAGARVVACRPLSPAASTALVASTFGDPALLAGTELGAALASGAHPALWVQESLRLAVEEGAVVRREGRWAVMRTIPARPLGAVLLARAARLPEAARELGLASAVLGAPATAAEIARTSGQSARRAAPALRELVRAGILEERTDARERVTYAMNDRFAEVVPTLFGRDALGEAHRRAARALSAARRGDGSQRARAAAHLLAAGDREGARAAFAEAVDEAERAGRQDLALGLLSRSMDATPGGGSVADHLRRFDLALRCGAGEVADASLRALGRRARAASAAERIEILIRMAQRAASQGRAPAARRRAAEALARAARRRDAGAQARAGLVAGEIAWQFGRIDVAHAAHRAAAARARAAGEAEVEARAWLGASLASVHLGRAGEALAEARRAARAVRGRGDPALRSDVLRQLGTVLRERGQLRRADASYRGAVRAARAAGCLEREAKALNNLGTVAQWLGEVRGAAEAFARSIALKERAGARASALASYNNLGALELALGAHEEARAHLARALDGCAGASPLSCAIAGSNLGDLELVSGRIEEAVVRYREALALCRARSFGSHEMHVVASLARALMMRASPADLLEASALVDALGRAARACDGGEARRRHRTTAAIREDLRGDSAAALEHARRAVRVRDRFTQFSDVLGTPLEAMWILALLLARAGRDAESARALARCRRELAGLAAMIEDPAGRARFLERHPVHAAITQGQLDLPRGWTWRPPAPR